MKRQLDASLRKGMAMKNIHVDENYTAYMTLLKFGHVYDVNELKSNLDFAERSAERMREILKEVEEYKVQIHERAQEILLLDYEPIILFERYVDYGSKRVEFVIKVKNMPVVEGLNIYHIVTEELIKTEHYKGKQRHEAIKRVKALQKLYPKAKVKEYGIRYFTKKEDD